LLLQEVRIFSSNNIIDDAYIAFRYADNLARGYGLVWNPGGEIVEGYTNFLWVILLACFVKLGFNMEEVAHVLGMIFSLATVFVTYKFSQLFSKETKLNFVAPMFLGFSSFYAYWARSGMETHMFTFLLLLGIYFYINEFLQDKKPFLSSVLFALSALTRPEGVMIFGITLIHRIWCNLFHNKIILTKKDLIWLFSFLIIFIPYFLWRYNYFGFLFPNTYYVKTGGGIFQYLRGFIYVINFVLLTGIIPYIPIIALFLSKKRELQHGYLLLIISAFIVYIIYVGGDWSPHARFFIPILPITYLCIQEGLKVICNVLSRYTESAKKRVVVSFCLITIMFVSCHSAGFLLLNGGPFRPLALIERPDNSPIQNNIRIGKYLRKTAQPNESVAMLPAGAIPYYSGLKSIDMLGLNDTYIAHQKIEDMGKGIAGHEKGDADYVLSKNPTYIILNSYLSPEPTTGFSSDHTYLLKFRVIKELLANPKFHQMYKPCSVQLENGLWWNFYKLKMEPQKSM
jgi:hypothetical protein